MNSANGAAAGAARETVARPMPGVRTPATGGGFSAQQAERGAAASNVRTGGATSSEGAGWRRFSDTNTGRGDGAMNRSSIGSSSGSANQPSGTSPGTMSNVPRPGNSPRAESSTNDGGWRHFTPQSGGNAQGSMDRMGNDRMSKPMSNGSGMNGRGADFPSRNQISRPDSGGRGMTQDSPRTYSRPPLEMRQPIVTPRNSEMRGSAPRESAPPRSSGGGGGGGASHGGGGGGGGVSHGGGGGSRSGSGGGPHGGSGRR